jgi:hypothetical protein
MRINVAGKLFLLTSLAAMVYAATDPNVSSVIKERLAAGANTDLRSAPSAQSRLYMKAELSPEGVDEFAARVMLGSDTAVSSSEQDKLSFDSLDQIGKKPQWFDPPQESDKNLQNLSGNKIQILKYKAPYIYYYVKKDK